MYDSHTSIHRHSFTPKHTPIYTLSHKHLCRRMPFELRGVWDNGIFIFAIIIKWYHTDNKSFGVQISIYNFLSCYASKIDFNFCSFHTLALYESRYSLITPSIRKLSLIIVRKCIVFCNRVRFNFYRHKKE